jgi:hypothetical protein
VKRKRRNKKEGMRGDITERDFERDFEREISREGERFREREREFRRGRGGEGGGVRTISSSR